MATFLTRFPSVILVGMDPNNPVVRLCVEGTKCEENAPELALKLFTDAWERSCNDFERCIAAHYVARHQKTATDNLRWNELSLAHANAVSDETVADFLPSLYLNLGKSHEDLGNRIEAKRFYELAFAKLRSLSPGRYHDVVRDGLERGLKRVA